jgi:Outer membrane efflux protein
LISPKFINQNNMKLFTTQGRTTMNNPTPLSMLSLEMPTFDQAPAPGLFANAPRLLPIALAVAISLTLSACGTVQPVAFTPEVKKERAVVDRAKMSEDQEAIAGPLSFEDAAARALRYNLDYRLKLAEQALAMDMLDVSRYDMLPKMLIGAGWLNRNNDSGGTSVGIVSGTQTLSPSTSSERSHSIASAELSWSALDFGMSYYRAQQRADGVLMADERRRKVIQNVMQDIRNTYWRALGAQRMLPRVDALLVRAEAALGKSRQIEAQKLLPPPTVLAYQRALIDAVSLLTQRRKELELARSELIALMNLEPGVQFSLADNSNEVLPGVPTNVAELERIAMEMRPELNEEAYRKRVTLNDLKVAQLSMFPNLAASIGWNSDSNKYLYNRNWVESGVRLSWNLLKLPQWPALKRAIGNQASVDDLRRYAQGMAVLTQVRIGVQTYGLSLSELQMSEQSASVDSRLLSYTRAAVKSSAEGELEVIRAEARALLTEYQRHSAYAQAQAAWGRVYNSVGLDVLPAALENTSVKGISDSIKATMAEWQKVTFQSAAPRAQAEPEVKLVAVGLQGANVEAATRAALGRNGIKTGSQAEAPWTIEVSFEASPQIDNTETARGMVTIKLANNLGQVVVERAVSVPIGEKTDAVISAAISSTIDAEASRLHAAFRPIMQADAKP